ncbi:MAG: class I SAM-dependent methyltransferase [Candidatus Omnitrophica bacterium]|nr:class I SAM-dependent methyltransferase [Candidatus Omnitrophota bacterium]
MSRLRVYDHPTLAAYARHADAAIADWRAIRHPSKFLRRFAAALPPRARVLDYGCGIGLELAWLRRQGCLVEGVDGTPAFLREARRRNPGVRLACARFETWPMPAGRYDGIWCQAALIHVPPDELRRQLMKLRQGLRPGGRVGATLAWGRWRGFTQHDWIPGRYLAAYSRAEAAAFFNDGWTIQHLAVTSHDGRHGRWTELLASPQPATV